MLSSARNISFHVQQQPLWVAWCGLFVGSILGAIWLQEWLLFAAPLLLLVVLQSITDYRWLFYLLLASIPFSLEIHITPSLGTDLPTEPLIVGLMLIFIAHRLQKPQGWTWVTLRHPLILIALLHFFWIGIATLHSEAFIISFKYFLTNVWYFTTFLFLAGEILRTEKEIKRFVMLILPGLLFTIIFILIQQAGNDFAFHKLYEDVRPFYRNHVNYAALMALFFPFLWYSRVWSTRKFPIWWIVSILILWLGIQFSYTRAAYLGLIVAAISYWVIQWRLMRLGLVIASIAMLLGLGYLAQKNNYLEYAPDFERTIMHVEFNDLMTATYNLEDISTMERVNRWVAGARMTQNQLLTGYGPGSFYTFYKPYIVSSFRTYVSDNPEQSTVHCYFLLMLIEQGIPGMLIFFALTYAFLIYGERVYHQTKSTERKKMVMMIVQSMIVIDVFLVMNDMIETDKVGSFFFMNIAMLVNMDLLNRHEKATKPSDT